MQRSALKIGFIALGLAFALSAAACHAGSSADALRAIAESGEISAVAAKLRTSGPAALDGLFQLRQQLETASRQAKDPSGLLRRIARLDEIIDQVGMQRYCSRSRLYWHTNLEEAKTAARASGKPILSLRMLGKLNEDYSCANSRFFRTTLYANDEISRFLRDNYVLHWKSVRPVPKVTIDFGDGRKLERTLTGNSIHYVLTPDGEVVDALPGLYGPQAFLEQITKGLSKAQQVDRLAPADRKQALFAYHTQQLAETDSAWQSDVARVSAAVSGPPPVAPPTAPAKNAAAPPATEALVIARPKALVEAPLVRATIPLAADPMQLQDDRAWEAIAALHATDAQLDRASRDLIRSQNPTAAQASKIAVTKRVVEDPLLRLVRSLESSIALDMVKNEYRLHREIHRWLSEASYDAEVETLNERVYTELFLTPSSDPWLGLAPADVYTALPNAGVTKN